MKQIRKRENVEGQVFGLLTALKLSRIDAKTNQSYWLFQCACGNKKVLNKSYAKNGFTKSCGCLVKGNNFTHGYSNTKIYQIWVGIRARCLNPKSKDYLNYGGRGIKICDHWLNSFENFLADMGERPSPTHSVDRINVNGNYEPSNCQWATPKMQANNRRNNIPPAVIDLNIGVVLFLLRNNHKLNQTQLAKKLKISASFVSEIESNRKMPTIQLLKKYADFFKIKISKIFLEAEKLVKEKC